MLQDLLEHVEQALELEEDVDELAERPLPPPIPNVEKSFWMSAAPHPGQTTSFSPPIRIRASK